MICRIFASSLMVVVCSATPVVVRANATPADAFNEAKVAIRSFPENFKQGGKELGHGFRDSGRAFGHAARDGYFEVRDGFRRDFIQGGAWRNRTPIRRSGPEQADPM